MRLLSVLLFLSLLSIGRISYSADAACVHTESLETVLSLMAKRLALAEDVARYKWNQQAAIEDSAREQLIIKTLVAQAEKQGLPAAWSERFFRAQIEASKLIQGQLFTDWQKQQAKPFTDVPDLNSQTRPKLYKLMSDLIDAVAKAWQPLNQASCKPVLEKLVGEKYAKPEYQMASAPLLAVPD